MATVPIPQSYQSILGAQFNTLRSRLGIKKLRPGGILLTMLEASSQSDFRRSADVFRGLEEVNLDAQEGEALDRIGNDEDCPRRRKRAASGFVTISDTAFTKKSSTIYHGKGAPIVGSTTVYVTKGDTFDTAPSTGDVYLGRGTQNYEGPLAYSAKVDVSSYWQLTVSATAKFHNLGESVILAQGDSRPISVGQIVSTPQGGATAPVTFKVTQNMVIADGETEIQSVPILCTVEGASGNVPAESISDFGSLPFSTATVTNPQNIQFGRNTETDNEYRERIRQNRANKQRGNDISIQNSVIDLTSPQEASSILSASLIRYKNKPSVLYIDDGNGYEEKSAGVGFETIVDAATGGETEFLSVFSPISQAYAEAANTAPYTLVDGAALTVRVGGVSGTHYFDSSEFTTPLSASAYDIVSSINSNSDLLFQARTTQSGTSFCIFSKSESNDDLEVIANDDPDVDAAIVFGLPIGKVYTTSVYLNDILLSKDGSLAQIVSTPFSIWAPLYTSETLILNTDGTGDLTVTITDADFQNLNYPLLSNATPTIWADVLTHKLPGVTATVENDKVILTSNKGKLDTASIEIVGGTLVNKGMFAAETSTGISNDYTIDRSVGSVVLNSPLSTGDKLTFGTQWSKAFVETSFGSSTVSLTDDSNYYMFVDDPAATIIPTGQFRAGALAVVVSEASPISTSFTLCSYPSYTPVTVDDIEPGDWLLLTDPAIASAAPLWSGVFRNNGDPNGVAGRVNISLGADPVTRFAHTVVEYDLQVYVFGGLTTAQEGIGLPGALKGRGVTGNCQKYDQSDGTWTQIASLLTPRAYHTATLLDDHTIFVCGGFDVNGDPLASTEIYDIATNTFTAGPDMPTSAIDSTPVPRVHHSATKLSTGNVLIAGGCDVTTLGESALDSTLEYVPGSNTYTHFTTMNVARYGHEACLDAGTDTVVVFGGVTTIANPAVPIVSVEQYVDTISTWTNKTNMGSARAFFGSCPLLGGATDKIIVAGCGIRLYSDNRNGSTAATNTSQAYDVNTDTWDSEVNIDDPGSPVYFSQSALLKSGISDLVVIGYATKNPIILSYYYDTVNNQWIAFQGNPYTSLYISKREATPGVAFNSIGPKGDTLAWFGGVSNVNETDYSFTGITNVDLVNAALIPGSIGSCRSHPAPTFYDITLDEGRLIAARSKYPPQIVTVPASSGYLYTADSFAPVINLTDANVTAQVYKTSDVRLSTLSEDGALLIADKDELLPEFSPENTTISQRSQYPFVQSRGSLDIPVGLQLRTVSSIDVNSSGLPQTVGIPEYSGEVNSLYVPELVPANGIVVGLQNRSFGANPGIIRPNNIWGNAKGTRSIIGALTKEGSYTDADTLDVVSLSSKLSLRTSLPVISGNYVYVAEPFKFSVSDKLNAIIDGDATTKRFSIPMARKLATVGSYQTPLSLRDADNGNNTLASAFGVDYDFDDFAIVSRARALTDAADATKRVLWRYYRYGEEGNNAAVRYVYPNAPDQPISVSTTIKQSSDDSSYYRGQPKVTADICVGSGSLRQNRNLTPDTKIGVTRYLRYGVTCRDVYGSYIAVGFPVAKGSRALLNGDTTLRVTTPLISPSGAVGLGISAGDILWYEGNSPSSSTMQTGQFTVKAVVSTGPEVWDITVEAGELNDGTIWPEESDPGLISTDPNQLATFDAEVQVGDLVVLNHPSAIVATETMRITEIDTNKQYILCINANLDSTSTTTYSYAKLAAADDLQIFAPATNTAAAIVAAVNADTNSPVSAVVTGTGAGTIADASWYDTNYADYRTLLTDGVNYVANTNDPANPTLQTTFDLKIPVTDSLTSNNDFANEVFYLVPQLAKSVVGWLNTPAVTGLWSVADVTLGENGTIVQIRSNTPGSSGSVLVEGGTANVAAAALIGNGETSQFNDNLIGGLMVTITKAESEGFCGNTFVELENTEKLIKVTNGTPTWGSSNAITSITADGVVTFLASPFMKETLSNYSSSITLGSFEKVGKYAILNILKGFGNISTILSKAGNWLHITGGYAPNNGTFRILRFTQSESCWTYWFENDNLVEQQAFDGLVQVVSDYSPIPGDTLSINSGNLKEANRGQWTILDIDTDYTGLTNTMTLDTSNKKLVAFSGSVTTTIDNVMIVEKNPAKAVKKVLAIAPSTNEDRAVLLLDDNSSINCWQQTAGTIVTSLSKLDFPTNIVNGNDAYRYNTGLIAEAKRVVYGDSADQDNYSGYAANGAQILFQGGAIKRLRFVVQVRLQNNDSVIVNRIRTAIVGVINSNAVGVPIPISAIIAAIESVNGAFAISVISPDYSAVNDQIILRGQEKAKVINPENDIQVIVAGN